MKTFNYPFVIYSLGTFASLCIMIIVDFILGTEAEYLNAWVIVNKLLDFKTAVSDSSAILHLGLVGSTALMIVANFMLGSIFIQLIQFIIRLLHS